MAKQTQRGGRNPEFGISPIPATQPPASSAPARDELQPPLLNPTAKTMQAAISLRGQRQGQDSPHTLSKHSQMEGTARGAQHPLQPWLKGQGLQGPLLHCPDPEHHCKGHAGWVGPGQAPAGIQGTRSPEAMRCGKHPSETRGKEIKKSSGMKQIINQKLTLTRDVAQAGSVAGRELLKV